MSGRRRSGANRPQRHVHGAPFSAALRRGVRDRPNLLLQLYVAQHAAKKGTIQSNRERRTAAAPTLWFAELAAALAR